MADRLLEGGIHAGEPQEESDETNGMILSLKARVDELLTTVQNMKQSQANDRNGKYRPWKNNNRFQGNQRFGGQYRHFRPAGNQQYYRGQNQWNRPRQMTSQNNTNNQNDVCRYHQQFGSKARNCLPPCQFQSDRTS